MRGSQRIPSLWLWLGAVGGPAAFALDRLAAILLVSEGCRTGGSRILGLTPSQMLVVAITAVTASIAIAAGLVSWRIWRGTGRPEDETLVGNIARVPFWALGGLFLSAIFLVAILETGVTALAVSTACP